MLDPSYRSYQGLGKCLSIAHHCPLMLIPLTPSTPMGSVTGCGEADLSPNMLIGFPECFEAVAPLMISAHTKLTAQTPCHLRTEERERQVIIRLNSSGAHPLARHFSGSLQTTAQNFPPAPRGISATDSITTSTSPILSLSLSTITRS